MSNHAENSLVGAGHSHHRPHHRSNTLVHTSDRQGQTVIACIVPEDFPDELTESSSGKRMLVNTHAIPDFYGGFVLYYVTSTWYSCSVILMRMDLGEQVGVVGTLDLSDPAEPTLMEDAPEAE